MLFNELQEFLSYQLFYYETFYTHFIYTNFLFYIRIMKTINYILFFSCLLFIACKNDLHNNDLHQNTAFPYKALYQENLGYMNMPRPADSYNYPVYPSMKEWEAFTTSQEMVDACQVPKTTLSKMSTQAVVQAIWEYPFLPDVLLRYEYQSDFEAMFSENNAYMELVKRKDAGTALFERLTLVNPLTPLPRLEAQVLEILISQTAFLSQLNDNDKKKIIEIAFANDDSRQSSPDSDSYNYYRATTWLLIGRTMLAANYSPFAEAVKDNEQLKFFIEGWGSEIGGDSGKTGYVYMEPVYGDIPQSIINFGKNYLNNK